MEPADPYGILSGCGAALAALNLGALEGRLGPAPPARVELRESGARSGDVCPECLEALVVKGIEYECPVCRAVFRAADLAAVIPVSAPAEPGAQALRGRLRMVGPESGWYQPDLDRTNPGDYAETQKKTTYAELKRLNAVYLGRGGNPFPHNVLMEVVTNYNFVQREAVKRSQMKRVILAALLFHACIKHGFVRSKEEVSEWAGLNSHGIARGDDYLRRIDEDKGLEINMNRCRLEAHIATNLRKLGLADARYGPVGDAVAAVVRRATERSVGIISILRSKVIATIYEVAVRGRALLRRLDPKAPPITVGDVVERCKVRKHTIVRFRQELANYHSLFADLYAAHGLASGPIAAVEAGLRAEKTS